MATITNSKQEDVAIYDILTDNAEQKILSSFKKLNIDKFEYEGKKKYSVVYYDTPENLLTKAGILLYKTQENGDYFFKIEKLNFLPNVSKLRQNEIFSYKVEARDVPKNHAFYLINGITSLFSTQFSIDFEFVIKTLVPKYVIDIQANVYKAFKGNGFKCGLEFGNLIYKNLITKRKRENKELSVVLTTQKTFLKDFKDFLVILEKYCKDIFPKKDTRFDYVQKITKPIIKEQKVKVEKAKKLKTEDIIEG
ncbi:MAG: hypothetical protein PHQ62_00635 [Clostridia bacterium]|nr:hypothetical protein [Clostridia bacterium]